MRTKPFFFMLSLIALLGACSSNEITADQASPNQASPVMHRISVQDSLHFAVCNFIATRSDIFGYQPLIFDSYEACDTLLENLGDYSFTQLRTWSANNHVHNDFLEAVITADSTYYASAVLCGAIFDADGMISDNDLDSIRYLALLDRIDSLFVLSVDPDLISITYNDNKDVVYEMVYELDHRIFTNEKSLYIVEGMVYRYLGDELIVCPYELYPDIAALSSLAAMQEYVSQNMTSYDKNRIMLGERTSYRVFESTNSAVYKTVIKVSVHEAPLYFSKARSWASATIYNTKKGNKHYCKTMLDIEVLAIDEEGNVVSFDIPRTSRERCIGNRTLLSSTVRLQTRSTPMYLTEVSVVSNTEHGAEISESISFVTNN